MNGRAGFTGFKGFVHLAGTRFVLCGGTAADGLVTHHLAIFINRGDIGINPIITTIFAAVFYHASPWFACLQVGPEIGKRCLGHVGVAHQIVMLPQHLFQAIACHLTKRRIGVGDVPFEVGRRYQLDIVGKFNLGICGVKRAGYHDQAPVSA